MANENSRVSRFSLADFSIDIIFTVIFTVCLLANVNIENRGWRVLVLLFCMVLMCLSKVFLLTTYKNRRDNTMIVVFMTTLLELGTFLNIDILGFETDRTFWEVADYTAGITGIVPVTACMMGVQYFVNPKKDERGRIFAILSIILAVVCVFGIPQKSSEISGRLLKAVTEIAFIGGFVAFFDGKWKRFSVDALDKQSKFYFCLLGAGIAGCCIFAFLARSLTSFRNAILEVLKVLVLLLFALFFHQKMTAKSKTEQPKKGLLSQILQATGQVLIVEILIFLIALSTSEFGTALILNLFIFLFVCFMYSFMSRKERKKNSLGAFIILFALGFVLGLTGVYFLCQDSDFTIQLKNIGLYDKLDRVFNLSDNSQIQEMNTALNESPSFFVALPYNVSLEGKPQTKVEDFSFMNIVTVFGTLLSSILVVIMMIVPIKMIEKIKLQYAGKSLYSVRNLFCIGGCILFIANAIIHITANFGLFMFTGVTLPFISNGFMNMAVFYLIFTQVLKTLDTFHVSAGETPVREDARKNSMGSLVVVFALTIAVGLQFHEPLQNFVSGMLHRGQEEAVETVPNDLKLHIQGYDRAVTAIQNVQKELDSYNITTTYYNYYTPSGKFLSPDGEIIFSPDTIVAEKTNTAYENYLYNKKKLLSYLFGNSKNTDYHYGYQNLMRTAPNKDNDSKEYVFGADVTLSLDDFRQHQLYELFYLNGTYGGCVVQNLTDGKIRVLTTKFSGNSEQKDGMFALMPVIDPQKILSEITQDYDGYLNQYLDLQQYRTTKSQQNYDEDEMFPAEKYCFLTDFDVVEESNVEDDYRISPLHLNSMTQRIFSGQKSVPTFLEYAQNEAIPCSSEEMLSDLQALYQSRDYSDEYGVTMKVCRGTNNGYYYMTGILENENGESYAFTLYGADALVLKYEESIAVIFGNESR